MSRERPRTADRHPTGGGPRYSAVVLLGEADAVKGDPVRDERVTKDRRTAHREDGSRRSFGGMFMPPRVGEPAAARNRTKWVWAAVWLVYLIGPLVDVATKYPDRSAAWKLLNWLLVGTFIAAYGTLMYASYPRTGRIGTVVNRPGVQVPLVLFLATIAAITSTAVNHNFISLWIYVGAGAGYSLPLERLLAVWGVFAAVVGLTVSSLIVGTSVGVWFMLLLPTFFSGMATLGIRRMAGLIAELREARAQLVQLATNEERLRLARDLHDLTGHSLSLITLKSELAQRMLERSLAASPDEVASPQVMKALAELGDIEKVSRQTLVDIREAVSNYRRPTLAVELSSASAALDAAGIKLDADPSVTEGSGAFDPEIEAVLAWCLREAVTNAVRHSGATRVGVRLTEAEGELVLSVRNDGRGLGGSAGEGGPDVGEDGDGDGDGGGGGGAGGNGLRGLRERLDTVGGRLTVGGKDGDFRLVAAVPLASAVRDSDGAA